MSRIMNVRLPDSVCEDLKALSQEAHVPLSSLVRESLREYLAVRRFRQIRKRILPFAEAQGLLSDDDVLRGL